MYGKGEKREHREEETYERERESLMERKDGRGEPRSKDLACNNVPDRFRGKWESRWSFGPLIKSRRNPSGVFTQEPGSFTGTCHFRDFQSIFQRSAVIQPLTHGDGVHVFRDVYVSHLLRETHIFISLLNEERQGEREERRNEEDKMQAIRGFPMAEIRQKQKKINYGLA